MTKVAGEDGQPLIETRGVELCLSEPWRDLLVRTDEETVVWARTFRKAHGTKVSPPVEREQHDEAEDTDPYAETEDEAADSWDRPETAAEGEVTT